MTATHADQIIAGYLKRLEAELSSFPSNRRKELTGQIAEHIAQARSELGAESDADLLTILDRLGEPEEIAAEARTRLDISTQAPGPLEILVLLLIGVGGVLFPYLPVAWVIGAGLVWRSKAWTPREKYRGAYVPLVVGLAILLVSALGGAFGGGHIDIGLFLVGVVFSGLLLPLGSAVYLGSRLGRRLARLAWVGIGIVALIVYLPAVAALIPARSYGFIGADGPPGRPVLTAGQPGCGGFYGTYKYAYGLPLTAKAPVSVGICWDGQRVTKQWGPDCFPEYGPGLVVKVQGCKVESQPDGSMYVSIQSSVSALTAPAFGQSASIGWLITPDGRVR